MENLKSLENFYEAFRYFVEVLVLLDLQTTKKYQGWPFQREMQKKRCIKTEFSQFNDKRFYLSDEITSLLLPHPYLEELAELKKKKNETEIRKIYLGWKRKSVSNGEQSAKAKWKVEI